MPKNSEGPNQKGAQNEVVTEVMALPSKQVAIVQSDSTEIDLIGLKCNAAGTVALLLQNDTAPFTWTVAAGDVVVARIKSVYATGTSLANGEMIGLQ